MTTTGTPQGRHTVPYSIRRKIDAATARGARALDTVVPGWHRRVKLRQLNMINAEACIVGQLATCTAVLDAVGQLRRGAGATVYGDDALLAEMIVAAGLRKPARRYELAVRSHAMAMMDLDAQVGYRVPSDANLLLDEANSAAWEYLHASWLEQIRARRRPRSHA